MQFYQFYQKAKQGPKAVCNYLLENIKKLWKHTESTRELITQGGIALYTSFSAFKSTIEMIPLIVSVLTVLATAPLLSYFLPTLLFDTTIMVLILASISGLVGYHKYHELKLRAELDKQTTKQGEDIKELNEKLELITSELQALKTKVDHLPLAITPHYSLRETPARQQRAHYPANDHYQALQRRPKVC